MSKEISFLSVHQDYFKQLEHYTDRRLNWIKLHLSLHDDFAFCSLPDQTKYHFIALLMLAVKCSNKIPADEKFLSQKISAIEKINLKILVDKKLLVAYRRPKLLKTKKKIASKNGTETEQTASVEREDKEQDNNTHTQRHEDGFVDKQTLAEIQENEVYKNVNVQTEYEKLLLYDAVEKVKLKRLLSWLNNAHKKKATATPKSAKRDYTQLKNKISERLNPNT